MSENLVDDRRDTLKKRSKKIAKNGRLSMRLGKEEQEMLSYIAVNSGESISKIVRDGVKMRYNLEKARH